MLVSCTDMPPALQPTNERDRRASPKREARAEPLLSWAFPGERERRNLFFQGPNLFCRCPQETLPSPSFANFAFLFSLSTSHLSRSPSRRPPGTLPSPPMGATPQRVQHHAKLAVVSTSSPRPRFTAMAWSGRNSRRCLLQMSRQVAKFRHRPQSHASS